MQEFKKYQHLALTVSNPHANMVVVAIDGNCSPFAKARDRVLKSAESMIESRLVVASPDPHIERWYLADPKAVFSVLGCDAPGLEPKCERGYYKNALRDTIARGGHMALLGGTEMAADLIGNMDFYRAGKNDSSFKAFLGDLKTKLRS